VQFVAVCGFCGFSRAGLFHALFAGCVAASSSADVHSMGVIHGPHCRPRGIGASMGSWTGLSVR
jgi:hypothetical protein